MNENCKHHLRVYGSISKCADTRCLEDHGCNETSDSTYQHTKRNTPKSAPFEEAFVCRLCQAKYDGEEKLIKHFRSYHSGRLPFQCSNCCSEFDSEFNESKHKCCKTNSDEFECVVCSKKLPSYNHLYFHISKEHSQKDSICKVCNRTFPNGEALREHSLSHREGRRFSCAFCPKAYSNSQYLTLHMKRHTSSTVLKCKICFRPFLDKHSLFQHMLFHASMPGLEKPFTCCLCYLAFSQRAGLKLHIEQSHILKQHMMKKCPVCNEVQLEELMSTHILQHCSRISAGKMTKIEAEWVKKKQADSNIDSNQTESKVKAKMRVKSDRRKHPSNYNLTKTTTHKKIIEKKVQKKTINERNKFSVANSNSLTNKKSSTLSNSIKTHIKKEENEDSSFKEDLQIVNKRLEESSDSEFESQNGSTELFNTFDSSANENILDVSKIKKETSETESIHKIDASISGSAKTTRKRGDLFKPVKTEEPVTKARPMSFLLVTSSDKTYSLSKKNNYKKGNEKKRGLLEITTKKGDFYENEVKERIMLSDTMVKKTKLRTSTRHTMSNSKLSVQNEMGKENLSLENNSSSNLELSEENVHSPSEDEESKSQVTDKSEPSFKTEYKEIKQDFADVCIQEKKYVKPLSLRVPKPNLKLSSRNVLVKENHFLGSNSPRNLEALEENTHRQTDREEVSKSPVTEKSEPSLKEDMKEVTQDFVDVFIQEKKYFEPSRNLSKYSCTTCVLTFSTQEELLFHNFEHI